MSKPNKHKKIPSVSNRNIYRNIKIQIFFILLVLLIAFVIAYFLYSNYIISINGEKITYDDFVKEASYIKMYSNMTSSTPLTNQDYTEIIINNHILLQEASKVMNQENISQALREIELIINQNKDSLDKLFTKYNINSDDYFRFAKNRLLIDMFIDSIFTAEVTDKELLDFYNENKDSFFVENPAVIYKVGDYDEGYNIINDLKNGVTHSDRIVPEQSINVTNVVINKDGFSQPFFNGKDCCYFVYQKPGVLAFEDIKDQLYDYMLFQKRSEFVNSYLDTIKSNYNIQIDNKKLENIEI